MEVYRRGKGQVNTQDSEESDVTFWAFAKYMIKSTFVTLPTILIIICAVAAVFLVDFLMK
jgi:hypothetical protein